MLRVVCASANPYKVAEIFELIGGTLDLVARPTDLIETKET